MREEGCDKHDEFREGCAFCLPPTPSAKEAARSVEEEAEAYIEVDLRGWKVLIDKADHEAYRHFGWGITYSDERKTHPYVNAFRRVGTPTYPPDMKLWEGRRLHRLLLNAQQGDIVDHINGNTLDNRRANLRLVSASLNARHLTRQREGKTSSFIGVSLNERGRWTAQTRVDGKQKYLGDYATQEEAAAVRDMKVMEVAPEGTTNFPKAAIVAFREAGARAERERVDAKLGGEIARQSMRIAELEKERDRLIESRARFSEQLTAMETELSEARERVKELETWLRRLADAPEFVYTSPGAGGVAIDAGCKDGARALLAAQQKGEGNG